MTWRADTSPLPHCFSPFSLPVSPLPVRLPARVRAPLVQRARRGTAGVNPPGAAPLQAIDCPDGLARCIGGVVEVSRLATIAQPCRAAPEACACPWDRVGDCEQGCVGDEVDVVMDRDLALRAAVRAPRPTPGPSPGGCRCRRPAGCDEEELYRCATAQSSRAPSTWSSRRARGAASSEGASLGSDTALRREAAFAILCSR